jgi:transposase
MMRVGLYRPVHVKTLRSQKLRMLLTHRKLLQSKAIAIDNDLRGTLRNFGLKVGMAQALDETATNGGVFVSRGRVWADVCQVSIGRGGMERQNITLRR